MPTAHKKSESLGSLARWVVSILLPVLVGVISGAIGAWTSARVQAARQQQTIDTLKEQLEAQKTWIIEMSRNHKADHDLLIELRTRMNARP